MNIRIEEDQLEKNNGWATKLPSLLRFFGATALLIAMYSFLIKGWGEGSDVYRYLLMLGHTALLTVVGLASGHWLKEGKGARLLLTLSLISASINFTVLGSFVYSIFPYEELSKLPQYVTWTVDSMETALIIVVGALFVLLPVIIVGFTALARIISTQLSMLFIIGNLTLLVPLREPYSVGFIALALIAILLVSSKKIMQSKVVAKTKDGFVAIGLLLLPLMILLGRTLWLYSTDISLLTISVIIVYFILLQLASILKGTSFQGAIEVFAFVSAVILSPLLYASLIGIDFIGQTFTVTISTLLSSLMIYRVGVINNVGIYKSMAGLMILVGAMMNVLLNAGLLSSILCLVSGLVVLFLGYSNKSRHFLIYGLILVIVGLAQHVYELVIQFNIGSWASMAIIGILAIVIASVIESKGSSVRTKLSNWKESFETWEV